MNKLFTIFFILIFFLRQIIILNANDNTYINTSNIVYDEEKNILELAENSKINIDNTNILVDRGIIDYNKNEIEVFGNFYLYQETNILSGKDLKGDTKLRNFSANEVSFIYNNDLKIDSDNASRAENDVYFYNNFITPCELVGYFGCPTWSLRIDKTKYDLNKDKFTHYDTFLQIADYKIFYLPYFTHYGSKAPRQKGFLTPTLEFGISGNSGIYTPYYLPIKDSTDIKFTPKFIFSTATNLVSNYELNTILEHKMSGGALSIDMDNVKYENKNDYNNTFRIDLKKVLDKSKILSFNGLITNSISTTRSKNEDPLKFEDIYLRLDNYNFAIDDDYLRTEISTIEAYDSTNDSLIPFTPHINYHNNFNIGNNISNSNEVDFVIIKRNKSEDNLPSENSTFKMNNYFTNTKTLNKINIYNKLSFLNNFSNYNYEHNSNLNSTERFNHFIISSDVFYNYNAFIIPRVKLIHNQDIYHTNKIINEDSNSLTFSYQNLFADNRFFGTDTKDNTSRLVYGTESNFILNKQKFNFNFSQSYDFNKNNNFVKKLNQNTHLSDYAVEGKTKINNFLIKFDARLDRNSFKKKEMNMRFSTNYPLNIGLNYHETQKNAFTEKSNDTEYLGINLEKKLNNNLSLSYDSNIDLKNNFSSYYDKVTLKVFDDCSALSIEYSNKRYNDNYNTSPEELLSINFRMDYLGFFGYEQTTDLFFQEPGSYNYGL
tara:strand:- start:5538 stop:7682 length:2145 start_codon:yes stop_codon:yes gene_type:complete